MTETAAPIKLAAIRLDAECWSRWEPPAYTAEHAEAVLALIEVAYAAKKEADSGTDIFIELEDALARFDFGDLA